MSGSKMDLTKKPLIPPMVWNFEESDPERMLENLIDSGFHTDFVFLFLNRDTKIRVHKIFLMMRSRVFHRLITQNGMNTYFFTPGKGVDRATFLMMIKFLYTGSSGVGKRPEKTQAFKLLLLAHDFEIPALAKETAGVLGRMLNDQDVLYLFQTGMALGNRTIMESCLEYICKNTDKIVCLPEWNGLRMECLIEILQQDGLFLSDELALFRAVVEWGHAECRRQGLNSKDRESLRLVLKKPLTYIRFLLIDREDFVLQVQPLGVLERADEMAIMSRFLVKKEKWEELPVPVPELRFQTTPRAKVSAKRVTVRRMWPENLEKVRKVERREILAFCIAGEEPVEFRELCFHVPEAKGMEKLLADVTLMNSIAENPINEELGVELRRIGETDNFYLPVDWTLIPCSHTLKVYMKDLPIENAEEVERRYLEDDGFSFMHDIPVELVHSGGELLSNNRVFCLLTRRIEERKPLSPFIYQIKMNF